MTYGNISPSGGDTDKPRNLNKRLKIILQYVSTKNNILDAGCGSGGYVAALCSLGADAYGVEFDRQKLLTAPIPIVKNTIRLLCGDIQRLPFYPGTFDVVLLNEVLEHVPNDDIALQEAYRVLRDGGTLIVFSPNRLFPFETHGVFARKSNYKIPHYIPFIPYIPLRIGKYFFQYWARNYYPWELRKKITQVGFKIIATDYVWLTFENISGAQPGLMKRLAPLLRRLVYILECTPLLNVFGTSQVIIARK